jgi:hypothetical protein
LYLRSKDGIREISLLANFLWAIGIVESEIKRPSNIFDNNRGIFDLVYADRYSPEWENAWQITKALILQIAKELEVNQVNFLVVVIPSELEFRPDQWNKILDSSPQMRTFDFDTTKPERMLDGFFKTNKIDYLMLRPEFERYSKESGRDLHFHYAYDNHWNSDGHRLAAEVIHNKLVKDHLVPR